MYLASWGKMRKYLEQEMIADSLKGRIRFNCTAYPNMDGMHIFEIFVDNKIEKQFSWETVNTYFRTDEKFPNGKGKIPPDSLYGYWTGFGNTLCSYSFCIVFDCASFRRYDNNIYSFYWRC